MANYATNAQFQTYVDSCILDTDDYDAADVTKRTKALTLATRAIDRLSFQGNKAVPGQQNQFPRGTDTTTPDAIRNATCELALALLAGKKLDDEFDDQKYTHEAFMGVKASKNPNFEQEHLVNGIISYEAWLLLKPFLKALVVEIIIG